MTDERLRSVLERIVMNDIDGCLNELNYNVERVGK